MIDTAHSGGRRDVGCQLVFEITENSLLAMQVAPASTTGQVLEERLEIAIDGGPAGPPIAEIAAAHGGRIHLVSTPPGMLSFDYFASVLAAPTVSASEAAGPGAACPGSAGPGSGGPGSGGREAVSVEIRDLDAIVALRQSRYCPSDALTGFAATEFFGAAGDAPDAIALRVASWVFERLAYSPGSSGPLDTAIDTLVAGSGVCRDFAHLTIALCRALGVPARLAAVYAPGLTPMDFHAVVEILSPGGWQVLDATRMAPRGALVRIATGRDAADTAFATTLRGAAELVASQVLASSDGDLPADDHTRPLPLA